MTKILLSLTMTFLSVALHATIHTVSNEAYYPAQFSSVQAAHDAASAGDTLLVSTTGLNYGDLHISKQISVFGNSFVPGLSPQFGTIFYNTADANGTVLQSLYIGSVQVPTGLSSTTFSNMIIRRCYLYSVYVDTPSGGSANHFTNWLIEGCVFIGTGGAWNMNTAFGYSRFENFTLRNNIFNGIILDMKYSSLKNNIFVGTSIGDAVVNSLEYCTFSNNITYGRNVAGGLGNTYNNNVTFGGNDNNFGIGVSQNVGVDNIINTDPNFINVTLSSNFNPTFDYHLQSGSPAIGAGDNGLDCGVYDGSGIFRMDGEPDIPVVRSVTIPGGNVVPAQSTFQITVNSVSHQ
jgi:hypothetical protein